ncbi:hypothetical protein LSO12E_210004 [Candidatus Liberibacter solanacearum]
MDTLCSSSVGSNEVLLSTAGNPTPIISGTHYDFSPNKPISPIGIIGRH